jgi:YbbR domain-containing protein
MFDRVWVNWPLKVMAISLAFALWVFASGEQSIVQDFEAPLDVQVPEHLALSVAPQTTVSVRLSGPEGLIRRIQPGDMAVSVELGDLGLGQQLVALSDSDLSGVPRGVEVEFIEPNPVPIELDDRDRRTFRLDVPFLGQPPEGYAFYGAGVSPEELTLEGPRTALAAIVTLETNPVRLDQRKAPFKMNVRLNSGNPLLQVVETGPIEVDVVVDMAPVERTFTGVPIEAISQIYETTVSPDQTAVTLSGPPALLEALRPGQLRLVVDVSGLNPFDQPRQVPLQLDLVDVPVEEISRISMKTVGRREASVLVSERRLR